MTSLLARSSCCSSTTRGLLLVLASVLSLAVAASGCIAKEREALLAFKAALQDPTGLLATWNGGPDCCRWHGVTCSTETGRVIKLDLQSDPFYDVHNPPILILSDSGAISPSLVSLAHLEYIDLSQNDFSGARIPGFIGSLSKLRHLDLNTANFSGKIPPQLGNLSRLSYLNIGYNRGLVATGDLHWLSRLSSLTFLGLSDCDLSAASGWLESVGMLSSLHEFDADNASLPLITNLNTLSLSNFTHLEEIYLSRNTFSSSFLYWLTNLQTLSSLILDECGFAGQIPESLGNLTRLEILSISENNLVGQIPESLGNLTRLEYLWLFDNNLVGQIPKTLGNLTRLKSLSMSDNNLMGEITGLIGGLCNLIELDLSYNHHTGDIADVGKAMARYMNSLDTINLSVNNLTGFASRWFESFMDTNNSDKLSQLRSLSFSGNSLHGTLTEHHLANLHNLSTLDLSNTSLRIAVQTNWMPPFQLVHFYMHSCQLGPHFPHWLRTQTKIEVIDLHSTGIVGPIPDWLWTLSNLFYGLRLSNNALTGKLPASLVHLKDLYFLDLSNNQLEGKIPDMPEIFFLICLSNNSFSGSLPRHLGSELILLSSNHLNGSIPMHLCDMTWSSSIVDLSRNNLTGGLPDCWKEGSSLDLLDLSNNNLEGEIPSSIGSLTLLRSLLLNRNMLSGMLPSSLKSCKMLLIIDISENQLIGSIPAWIGESLRSLVILRLRSNQFSGNIPSDFSLLQSLQVLDLGNNKLSGTLPHFLGNYTAQQNSTLNYVGMDYNGMLFTFRNPLDLITKGVERTYLNLDQMTSIDLSDNKLTGEIPNEIGALVELTSLNLSRNRLSGCIPDTIGGMQQLESFDLSWNRLSGVIPQTLASIYSLERLNLSYNNLSGQVPQGSQLQTLRDQDPYIYVGNRYLCNPLAPETCSTDKGDSLDHIDHKDDHDIWLYVLSGLGFGFGFAIVWWILIFSKATGDVYFRFIDSIYKNFFD